MARFASSGFVVWHHGTCLTAAFTADTFFCVVDLHAITVPHDALALRHASHATAAAYMASGIDTSKSSIFMQSHVTGHSELAWLLGCYTPIGWLERMTQFKVCTPLRCCALACTVVAHGPWPNQYQGCDEQLPAFYACIFRTQRWALVWVSEKNQPTPTGESSKARGECRVWAAHLSHAHGG
jgi:hypothetical protein